MEAVTTKRLASLIDYGLFERQTHSNHSVLLIKLFSIRCHWQYDSQEDNPEGVECGSRGGATYPPQSDAECIGVHKQWVITTGTWNGIGNVTLVGLSEKDTAHMEEF